MKRYDKDPDSVGKYTFDWSKWLAVLGSDTISTSTWILDSGLTNDSDSNTTTEASITLSGGSAGRNYTVTNRIVTAAGLTEDRSWIFRVVER